MISFKSKLHISFLFFLISAFYGLLLRINFFLPFDDIVHTWIAQGHSHVAFLGWGFLATTSFLNHQFLNEHLNNKKEYNYLFIIFVISILGMFISFPLEGYDFFSILFLSIFGLTSYVYSYHFLRDLKQNTSNKIDVKFAQWAIYYYLISSIAIWTIGPILVTLGKTTLYYNGVYFYLHFLYNGFFVFALFGILFNFFKPQLSPKLLKKSTTFFILTNIACIPAYALSILWSEVHLFFNIIGFVAAFIQVISLYYLIPIILKIIKKLPIIWIQKALFYIVTIAYSLKVLAQVASSLPEVIQKSITLKSYFIIGYLHLFTLLFMSLMLIIFIQKSYRWKLSKSAKIALSVFLIGIMTTELLLFTQGFYIWIFREIIPNFNWYNLLASTLLFTGLCFYYLYQFALNNDKIYFLNK